MSGVNVRNLEKIQDKWLLFQRFVTSIVADALNTIVSFSGPIPGNKDPENPKDSCCVFRSMEVIDWLTKN